MEREKFDRNKPRVNIGDIGQSWDTSKKTTTAAFESLGRSGERLRLILDELEKKTDIDFSDISILSTPKEMEEEIVKRLRAKQYELEKIYGSSSATDDPELVDLMGSLEDDEKPFTM